MEGNEDKQISELTVFMVTYIILLLLCHALWTTLPAKMDENVFCPVELNQWKVRRVGVRSSSTSLARRSTLSVARQRELHNWKLEDSQVFSRG